MGRKTLQLSLLGIIWNRYNSIKKRELLTMLLQTGPVLQKEFTIDDVLNNAARLVFGLKVVNKADEPNDISTNNLPEQMANDMVDKILKHELCIGNNLSRVEGQKST
ncbi:hypothetical protein J7E50_25310 [Pedobacter sp. ISL-68]|uniref:hypothetical protein n=1 Tax=unclassified Pedobacter TaxID=2628915 RepID=UPI001BE5BBC2|nr:MULTISPECIES: hypothetical protein [unclassified Pedobacter]MBT2564755.1 hypothetical protein [Pedobacter sp. ISL-64]MBT2593566.1 hypothetical protein [Pedobacter sp. ISL-68]